LSCRLYLVRHGETAWNAEIKLQGHADIPLSERGKEQASLLAGRLAKKKISAVYASDLQRASETAQIIAEHHKLAVKQVKSLREMNFGAWEGLTWSEINEKFGNLAERWWENPLSINVPEGETLKELALRVNEAIHQFVRNHTDGQEILVVSHGGPLRAFISSILGINLSNFWRLRLDNACLSIIDFMDSKKGILVLFNDRNHLE